MARDLQTRTWNRRVTVASAALASACTTIGVCATPASAVVVTDQSNTGPVIGSVVVDDTRDRGQTFVAGVSGALVGITLNGCDRSDATTSMTLSLYRASGTAPNSVPDVAQPPLAQVTLTGARLTSTVPRSTACQGNEGDTFTVPFDSPAQIIAGTAYSFVIDAIQSPYVFDQGILLASTDYADYPRGNRSVLVTGTSWVPNTTRNLRFTTLVDDGRPVGPGVPDIVEMFGLPVSGMCSDVPDTVTPNIADRVTGWSPSWTEGAWLNEGRGGPVCVRTLRYSATLGTFDPVA
jgi:hypothetical protein